MQKRNIKMGLIAILASAILAGALACGSGNDSDLKRIEQMAIDLVSQEVLDARVARVEDTNTALSDRITELEEAKQALRAVRQRPAHPPPRPARTWARVTTMPHPKIAN